MATLNNNFPIVQNTNVHEIDYSGTGVKVVTSKGTITARGCICTVSIGVLKSEKIKFFPTLSSNVQKALNGIRNLAIEEVTKIASEKKIDLILKRDSSVIFLPHLNISDEVLKRLNERTKDARIEVEINKQNVE